LALNKRKVLDAARKYAQKGAKEKALKEYAKLLKADGRDAKLLLEIGDTHRRWGRNEEAISHYQKVAEQYKQGGFDARAVAVFKQIINLDAKRYPAYVSLADLYQRMGLDAEAANALQTAADGYHTEGRKVEALELLRKMATLDPTNTTSRIKVAELLRQEQMLDDAVAEYEAVAEELTRQGADDELVRVFERILEIRPERHDIEFVLARSLVQLSSSERAEPHARRVFDHKPEGDGHFELLNKIYNQLGKTAELSEVTRRMAQHCRERGDDAQARELMQRLPGEDALTLDNVSDTHGEADPAGDVDPADLADDVDETALLDDDFLDDDLKNHESADDRDEDSFIDVSDQDEEAGLDPDLEPQDAPDAVADASLVKTPEEVLSTGDPDQLFAEASVYLRYGRRDQAISSLEAILAQEPQHRAALEKIGECFADGDDVARAVSAWSDAAQLANEAGDEAALDVLRERIAVLDPDAAAELGPSAEASSAQPTDPGTDATLVVEMDDDADSAADVDVDLDVDVDVDVDVDMDVDMDDEEQAGEDDPEPQTDYEISLDQSYHDISIEDIAVDLEDPAEQESEHGSRSSSQAGASSIQVVAEDLEEAEFYMSQHLFNEARAIYQRVLNVSPNHPVAMLRLGELEAAQGGDPAGITSSASVSDDVTLDPSVLPLVDSSDPAPQDIEGIEDIEEPDDTLCADHSAPHDVEDVEAQDSTADDVPVDVASDNHVESANDVTVLEELGSTNDLQVATEEPIEPPDAADRFDLAAALHEPREATDPQVDRDDATASRETTGQQDDIASIFKDFKSGVEEALAEGDFETRFDLGIAYRGMELFDDALGEFQICLDSPGHRLESLHMMGLCAIDLERYADATSHLEQALAGGDVPEPKQAGLHFDLGRAFEGLEDFARAKQAFEAAKAADETIPEIDACIERVAERIALDSGLVPVEDESADEGFEDFDDLVAEVEADEVAAAIAADTAAESAGPSDADSAVDETRKRKKKKRISFI